jgi:hypothetical protein
MTIFDVAQFVLFGGIALAVAIVVMTVVLAARRKTPAFEGDDRDTELVLHGELGRRNSSGNSA